MNDENTTWIEGDIDDVIIKPINKHDDDRGWLAEVFRSDEIASDLMPVMSYLSVTKPQASRGPHAHHEQTDIFAFMGPGDFELKLWDNRSESPSFGKLQTLHVGEKNPTVVTVPPGVVHGYKNISDIDAWVTNCPNRLFAGEGRKEPVDEIRHENEQNSPFTI